MQHIKAFSMRGLPLAFEINNGSETDKRDRKWRKWKTNGRCFLFVKRIGIYCPLWLAWSCFAVLFIVCIFHFPIACKRIFIHFIAIRCWKKEMWIVSIFVMSFIFYLSFTLFLPFYPSISETKKKIICIYVTYLNPLLDKFLFNWFSHSLCAWVFNSQFARWIV